MSGGKLARNLLWLLVVLLVAAGIGLVVHISRQQGSQSEEASVFDPVGCLICHADPSYQPRSSSRPWQELLIDGSILARSVHRSVPCSSCHRQVATGRPVDAAAAEEICGRCHGRELALIKESVHSDPEVVSCRDCHSPSRSGHDVVAVHSPRSPASPEKVVETCGGCHSDEKLMARYGLNPLVEETYLETVHGKMVKLTRADVDGLNPATCTSCHGSHAVKATDDPTSPLHTPAGLAGVCSNCHRGANETFARTLGGHEEHTSRDISWIAHYGERFFFMLTASVVGLGILMVGLEGFGWLRGQGNGNGHRSDNPGPSSSPRSKPPGNPANPGGHQTDAACNSSFSGLAVSLPSRHPPPQRGLAPARTLPAEIVRFDAHQRLQHFLMMTSFLVLAFTGLPQKFPDWQISQWLISLWGGLDTARNIHRFFGLVMISNCIYHLSYVAYSTLILKRPFPIWMIPTPKDLADFFQDLRYWFGRSKEKPKFGRFSYREKFDYWAIFWGMPVMATSGLILMFPVLASRLLPSDAVAVALVAHSDEAVLAVLWIFIVHFFFVHLNPRFFPLNRAIFTGRMPIHLYAEEHPLELAALEGSAASRHEGAGFLDAAP